VVILTFNNACYGWIKAIQRIHCEGEYLGVDFSATDHAAVAQAYGLRGVRVERAADLESVFEEAIAWDGPVLVDLPSESEELDLPQVCSWREAAETAGIALEADRR
jgi:acetolactate synthase I/II/III large subunit